MLRYIRTIRMCEISGGKKFTELTLLMVFIPVEVIVLVSGPLLPVSAAVVAFALNCTTPGLTLSFYT